MRIFHGHGTVSLGALPTFAGMSLAGPRVPNPHLKHAPLPPTNQNSARPIVALPEACCHRILATAEAELLMASWAERPATNTARGSFA